MNFNSTSQHSVRTLRQNDMLYDFESIIEFVYQQKYDFCVIIILKEIQVKALGAEK